MLRVLEGQSFKKVGGKNEIRSDFRIVAATNANLPEMIAKGKFRQDLYYRLDTVSLNIKPLRKRSGDIALLVQHFVEELPPGPMGKFSISDPVIGRLATLPWLGNIRQLKKAIEGAAAQAEGNTLNPDDFDILRQTTPHLHLAGSKEALTLEEAYRLLVEQGISEAQIHTGMAQAAVKIYGEMNKAAAGLKINRTTLYKWLHPKSNDAPAGP